MFPECSLNGQLRCWGAPANIPADGGGQTPEGTELGEVRHQRLLLVGAQCFLQLFGVVRVLHQCALHGSNLEDLPRVRGTRTRLALRRHLRQVHRRERALPEHLSQLDLRESEYWGVSAASAPAGTSGTVE
eukprot:680514-Prorocentrum_minimum.AAC.2